VDQKTETKLRRKSKEIAAWARKEGLITPEQIIVVSMSIMPRQPAATFVMKSDKPLPVVKEKKQSHPPSVKIIDEPVRKRDWAMMLKLDLNQTQRDFIEMLRDSYRSRVSHARLVSHFSIRPQSVMAMINTKFARTGLLYRLRDEHGSGELVSGYYKMYRVKLK
jgi:hypothetical protein